MRGLITAQVKVVNRWIWDWVLPSTRAEDCRGKVLFFPTPRSKYENVYHVKCGWGSEGTKLTEDISASFYPEVLTLFRLDPLTHQIPVSDEGRDAYALTPSGNYEIGLILDYKNGNVTEISLGKFKFPNFLLAGTQYQDEWKLFLKDTEGYAAFFETRLDGQRIVNVVGKMPEGRRTLLRKELVGEVEIRQV